MQSNFPLTKWSLVFLITIFSNLVLSQTAEEFKRTKKLRIEKETDSLILIRDQKNKELEKIELDNLNQTSQLREKLKYDEIKQNQKNLDSSINVINSKLDSLKIHTSRDNLLDSLFKDSYIKIEKPNYSSTTRIGLLRKDILDNHLGTNTGNLTDIIKEELLKRELKEIESKRTLFQLQDKNLFLEEDFFEVNKKEKDEQILNYLEKSEDILNSLGSDNYCFYCSPTYVIVNKEIYFKLKGAGILKGNSDIQKKADKIKEDEFLLIKFKKNEFENKAIITLNEKSQFIVDGNSVYLKQDFDYNQLQYGEPISSKKLSKIKDKYNGNKIVFFNDERKNKFLNDYRREWSLVQNYQNSILLKSSLETKLNELKAQKSLVDKKMNEIKNEISSSDSKNNSKVKKLQYEIDQLNNSINLKDDKIKKMLDDENLRVTLIIDGNKNLEQKNYEQAISNFESAINIRNSVDINVKLTKARDLYAPILAIKKEKEKKRQAEEEKLRQLEEEKRQTENEDWHSEDILKNWLLEAPFYNYEKTVKVEFRQEYEEDLNIGWMIWVYVNGNKEGELIKYKLLGSPHNTFIDIKWIRTGKTESVINVVSSSEKVKKSKRGSMTGIGAIKNGSNLRREGCSFD
jgi:hypothetical protein